MYTDVQVEAVFELINTFCHIVYNLDQILTTSE